MAEYDWVRAEREKRQRAYEQSRQKEYGDHMRGDPWSLPATNAMIQAGVNPTLASLYGTVPDIGVGLLGEIGGAVGGGIGKVADNIGWLVGDDVADAVGDTAMEMADMPSPTPKGLLDEVTDISRVAGAADIGAGLKNAANTVGERLNQRGPVPVMGSNMGNIGQGLPATPVRGFGDNGGPRLFPEPTLLDALTRKAEQMTLPPKKRIQPDPGRIFLDRDYQDEVPGERPNLADSYPRNPKGPDARLPKADRARILVDMKKEIGARLAEKIRATGQMDMDTRYFYHSDGPIYRAAIKAGLSHEEALQYVDDLGQRVAATSPRTKVEENLRNATLVMAKERAGVPVRDVIGPGTMTKTKKGVMQKGISERGYPMMTGKGGIHGGLLDDLTERGAMNPETNPKPSNFGPNVTGNRSGVTVDTHAIRATIQTLNELVPGGVPSDFIVPKFRKAYAADPSILTPDMISDTMASQMVGPKGKTTKMMTEYPVFADIWHEAADILGVTPAEVQSMGWFGFGGDTNLGSAYKTPADVFDERLSVTAKMHNISVEEAAKLVFRRKIPLASLGAGGAIGAQGLMDHINGGDDDQRRQA